MARTLALASMTILDLMTHPRLLGSIFAGPTWEPWKSILRCEYALPVTEEDQLRRRSWSGREGAPVQPVRRSYRRIGRRGGKDTIAALEAVYLSAFRRYPLRVGEAGVGLLLAADRRQSAMLRRTVRAFFRHSPLLESLIVNETQDTIELSNGVLIEIVSANLTSPRNRTIVWAICNEVAFWPQGDEAASPDVETLNAIEPGMATIPNAKIVVMSSPYAKTGVLATAEERYHGREDADGLYWVCSSRDTNPSIDQGVVDRALAEDPSRARSEYLSAWREDVESFVSRDVVLACIEPGVRERAPVPGRQHRAFVDPAGGSGQDSFTLAVGHQEQDGGESYVVVDAIAEWQPKFSPEAVIGECAQLLRRYGCTSVTGDRFAGEFPREQFRRHAVRYDTSDRAASDLYRDSLPLLTSGRLELLDHDRLIAQLIALERRTGRSGKDAISHRPGSHDDVANAVCGLAATVSTTRVNAFSGLVW